ncbi:hypothetical protein AAG589_07140 [Isoptericola sp. F-RaC21]|uniref:hypothetical protein n=1 Tax=Isoptericola sp. F-RaC21 TaxID=3141452 RepID=UPI00315C2ED9
MAVTRPRIPARAGASGTARISLVAVQVSAAALLFLALQGAGAWDWLVLAVGAAALETSSVGHLVVAYRARR